MSIVRYFCLAFNLNSSVGQGIVFFCVGVGQGVTARNGHSLSSSYNAAIRRHRSAICSVVPFTLWVKGKYVFFYVIHVLIYLS